ncbi:MAG: transposase [Phycisphaerales bacterium]|jgi:REP element-mobilizing transposase RayT|nr:transposase [Phycisphaerales bacterium]
MLTFFLTWTTYGTWLHGDDRGSVVAGRTSRAMRFVKRDPEMLIESADRMAEEPLVLDADLRRLVEGVIREHCAIRAWRIHAINVRSNHVHVVLDANVRPEVVMGQLKAWSSRALHERLPTRERIWTRHGSTRWLKGESAILHAIDYVMNQQ